MLSMTDADTTISFATPDDVRQASEKAFHIWVGAFSPLWAPFMAATAAGLGFWSMSQAAQRSFGFAGMETLGPDTHLFAKWPGFGLPFAAPWSKGWAAAAEDADRIAELTHDTLSAPMQIAFEAEEKLEQAVEEAVATAHESLEALTSKTDDLFSVAEAADRNTAEAATPPVVAPVETAVEVADAVAKDAEAAVDKTAEAVKAVAAPVANPAKTAVKTVAEPPKKVSAPVTKSAGAVIDPVVEAPVVPSVAEATAEKLPLPLTDVSAALAPRKPRKPKA